jgi:hypothetical protein
LSRKKNNTPGSGLSGRGGERSCPGHFFFDTGFFVVFLVVPHFFEQAITPAPPRRFLMGLLNTLILTLVKKILAPPHFIVTHGDKERYDDRRCPFSEESEDRSGNWLFTLLAAQVPPF